MLGIIQRITIIAELNLTPRCKVADIDRLKAIATRERIATDACDRVADRHRGQSTATAECILTDACNRVRNFYRGNVTMVIKSKVINFICFTMTIGRESQIGFALGIAKEIADISILIEEIAVLGLKDLARGSRIRNNIECIIPDIAVILGPLGDRQLRKVPHLNKFIATKERILTDARN